MYSQRIYTWPGQKNRLAGEKLPLLHRTLKGHDLPCEKGGPGSRKSEKVSKAEEKKLY